MGGTQNNNNGFWMWVTGIGSHVGSGNLRVYGLTDGIARLDSTTLLLNTGWHSVAFTRKGLVTYLFIDGVLEDTYTAPSLASYGELSLNRIMADGLTVGYLYTGNMDELRITKGVCRYVATYEVPTEAFKNESLQPLDKEITPQRLATKRPMAVNQNVTVSRIGI